MCLAIPEVAVEVLEVGVDVVGVPVEGVTLLFEVVTGKVPRGVAEIVVLKEMKWSS